MPAVPSIDELCRRHGNEDVHTEHVTQLALTVFDTVGAAMGLRPADRTLLEVAGRLHDIGFAHGPADHVRAGAEIILRGVRGIARQDLSKIAAIVLLHGGPWELALKHRVFRTLSQQAHIRRLGAILRLADGLDHGHIQDARIVDIVHRQGRVRLRVACPGYEGNVSYASQKADLWQAVMPVGLGIQAAPADEPPWPYAAVLDPSMSALEAARRLLFVHDRMVRTHGKLALVEDDPIHLHDIRVGLRRFRSVLRLFRDDLAGTRAEALNGTLRRLSERLGPLRDADVWHAFLESRRVARHLRGDSRWVAYKARQRRLAARSRRQLLAILTGPEYTRALLDVSVLLRVQLPRQIRARRVRRAGRVVGARISRILRRLTDHDVFRRSLNASAMHEVRILTRRGRYWSDFAAPLCGKHVATLARRLKGVADALGSLHDLDVALEELAHDQTAPRALRTLLRADRAVLLTRADSAWRKLNKKRMLEQASQALEG